MEQTIAIFLLLLLHLVLLGRPEMLIVAAPRSRHGGVAGVAPLAATRSLVVTAAAIVVIISSGAPPPLLKI